MNEATEAFYKAYVFNRGLAEKHNVAGAQENADRIVNAIHALWPDFNLDLEAYYQFKIAEVA